MTANKTLLRIVCLCVMAALFISLPQVSFAATSEDIREDIDELEQREQELAAQLQELERQRTQNTQQIYEMVAQKNLLDQQINLLYQQLAVVEEQMTAMKLLIADKQDEVDAATAVYEELNARSIDRIRIMEENGPISYWSILFHAKTFTDFLDRINIINEIAASDRARLEELRQAARQVSQAKEALEEEQQRLAQTQDKLQVDRSLLEQKREESSALLVRLAAKGDEFQALIDAGEQEQQLLLGEIARMEDVFDRVAFQEWLDAQPKPKPEPEPEPPKQEHCPPPPQHGSIMGFLRQLLPAGFDTGDLIVVLLLLLMAGDKPEDKNTALLTLALYCFL